MTDLTEDDFSALNPDGNYQVIITPALKKQILDNQDKADFCIKEHKGYGYDIKDEVKQLEAQINSLQEDYDTLKKWQESDKNREIVQKIREWIQRYSYPCPKCFRVGEIRELKEFVGDKK